MIGLIGSPGAGKSTCAAWLFAQMRLKGMKCELVSEFAKDLFWDESNAWKDQLYVFASQFRLVDRVLQKTDYVVTDSPPILSMFFNRPHTKAFTSLVLEKCSSISSSLYLLKRTVPYDSVGRRETEAESDRLHMEMRCWLRASGMKFEEVDSDVDGWNYILERIM